MVSLCQTGTDLTNTDTVPNNAKTIPQFIGEKNKYIQQIIRNTIISIKRLKTNGIFSANDTNLSLSVLTELYTKTNALQQSLRKGDLSDDGMLDDLQQIINRLSSIICSFGTSTIDDLLFISFGTEFKNIKTTDEIFQSKYQLLKQYIIPTGYKIMQWKSSDHIPTQASFYCSDKITENMIDLNKANMFECYDVDDSSKSFYQQVFGIRIIIQNPDIKKTLIINGIVNDIQIECITNEYVDSQKELYKQVACNYSGNERIIIDRLIETRTLKDVLLYSENDLKKQVIEVITEVGSLTNSEINIYTEKFITLDIYSQRKILVNLLTNHEDKDTQYACYMLYNLISTNNTNSEDRENEILYDSLPWELRLQIKGNIKHNLKYTHDKLDQSKRNKITLEQKICMLKVSDETRERAIVKLNEIKGKPDEMVIKTRQYLEGIVRIPFGIYKKEPILCTIEDINALFINNMMSISTHFPDAVSAVLNKSKYTTTEIVSLLVSYKRELPQLITRGFTKILKTLTVKDITCIIRDINTHKRTLGEPILSISNTNKEHKISAIIEYTKNTFDQYQSHIIRLYDTYCCKTTANMLNATQANITLVSNKIEGISEELDTIMKTLDNSIYSHTHAKTQILKIIGQWMNGEQGGYCFGFEGSPGIGKTSLAKSGLTKCLMDEDGSSRPFAFIALGGSTNGSSLEGHGYTYLNSTWGRIVDILMETKCMNPIIYIDELDKVSNTEQGKEIIGILTHLIDATQNEKFQDKYFTGIDIDMSKVLFIFSYNDPAKIDKILLDRIHRIPFENLSIKDKKVIVRDYILPEMNKRMGLENIITMEEEVIEHIIQHYTMEPGVRKLKEILFDLYGVINLKMLRSPSSVQLPYKITIDELETKYLTQYNKITTICSHKENRIGIINGLWANNLSFGGITPIQTSFYPSLVFLELQLTGLQGDIMKESMTVAKTLAWNMLDDKLQKKWIAEFNKTKCQGLHIHCPDGSISKDGPSAGAAITSAIYSLLGSKPIKNDVAITGEINLSGEITAIGGLENKITGGIRAGIKKFLFPYSNRRDLIKWKDKNSCDNEITFVEISHIRDVFTHIFT